MVVHIIIDFSAGAIIYSIIQKIWVFVFILNKINTFMQQGCIQLTVKTLIYKRYIF